MKEGGRETRRWTSEGSVLDAPDLLMTGFFIFFMLAKSPLKSFHFSGYGPACQIPRGRVSTEFNPGAHSMQTNLDPYSFIVIGRKLIAPLLKSIQD